MKRLLGAGLLLLAAGQAYAAYTPTFDSLAITNPAQPVSPAIGSLIVGPTAVRQMTVIPNGTAGTDSRVLTINRVGSASTDVDVFKSTWVITHSGANAAIQHNTYVTTGVNAGANPGETWNFLAQLATNANSDLGVNHVAAYTQVVRNTVPVGKVGVNIEGHVIEARSQTGVSSATDGVMRTLELDMFAAGADDYATGGRLGREVMPIVLGKNQSSDASPTFKSLIGVYPNTGEGVSLVSGIAFANQLNVTGSLWNTINAVQAAGAHMIWMRDGHHVAFDTAGLRTLSWDGTSKLQYQVSSVERFSVSDNGFLVTTNASTDHSSGGGRRPNLFTTTIAPSVNTTNVWENWYWNFLLNGPGQANGEINLIHPVLTINPGALSTSSEVFEASLVNAGTVVAHVNYLALPNNQATGTATTIFGFKANLINANTTAGAIGQYAGLDCEAMSGGGAIPTTNYCVRNGDTAGIIATLGQVSIGQLVPATTVRFYIQGPDSLNSTAALQIKNAATTNLLLVADDGAISGRGPLTIGLTGSVAGAMIFASDTSGTIKIQPVTGAHTSSILFLPAITANDTIVTRNLTQTISGINTFSGTANFTGTVQGSGVTAVSCASGTVTAATIVVSNGIVTHC